MSPVRAFHAAARRDEERSAVLFDPLPQGVWPVVLTPFDGAKAVDFSVLSLLLDWHMDAGAAGLFVCAGSAEVYSLSQDEQIGIVETAVRRAAGRVPVIAGAITRGSLEQQSDFALRVGSCGVRAVVLSTSMLVPPEAGDAEWRSAVERLMARTDSIPLGLYEFPQLYHRPLSAELLRWAASTGRFVFHKDTCGRQETIREKIAALGGTSLRFYNADTRTLLESLRAGGHGFSGIGANFFPELYATLCSSFRDRPEVSSRIDAFLRDANGLVHTKYMTSAKAFLSLRGLPITLQCRAVDHTLTDDDWAALRALQGAFERLCRALGVAVCPFRS